MTNDYNATIELTARADAISEDQVDEVMAVLEQYSPAVGRSARGFLEVVITLPAASLDQAVTTALAVVRSAVWAGVNILVAQVMTTEEFDKRADMQPLPSMIGTAEAAEILGVSQQRVLQLVNAGQLGATKAGRALALARMEVVAFGQRERPTGRPRARA